MNGIGTENSMRALIPGSPEEIKRFKELQDKFSYQFETAFPDPMAPKTVVIIPSLTLDQEILSKVKGHVFYEERLLCLLMLLRMPNTYVIYVTSIPVDPVIIDYYLHLLPGITGYHARQRLTLLSCYDTSNLSLTEKILARPRLLARLKNAIPANHVGHLACFTVSDKERTLAVKLGMPVYGCDPDFYYLGTKSESRKLFKECGIPTPRGFENLRDENDITEALAELYRKNPSLRKAVIKMNDGFSGEGNAIFSFSGFSQSSDLVHQIRNEFNSRLKPVADDLGYEQYIQKYKKMHGIVEEFVEGSKKMSPSVQCRINPLGITEVISTHDQVLGGTSGQVFMGAHFPANKIYSVEIGRMGRTIADRLKQHGVLGRFSIDFISVPTPEGWEHYAIEINLRKGGTTHPFLMLQFLTDGEYDAEEGTYRMLNGHSRCYYTTDNLKSEHYKGLTPHDLIDIAIANGLHYDAAHQQGVMFHLVGALSQFGKLGLVSIGSHFKQAEEIYRKTASILEREGNHVDS